MAYTETELSQAYLLSLGALPEPQCDAISSSTSSLEQETLRASNKTDRRHNIRILAFVFESIFIAGSAVVINYLRPGNGLPLDSIFIIVAAVISLAFAIRQMISSADPHPLATRHCSPKQSTIAYLIAFGLMTLGVNLVSSGPTFWPISWTIVSAFAVHGIRSLILSSGWGFSSGGIAICGDSAATTRIAESLQKSGRCRSVRWFSHKDPEGSTALRRMVNRGEVEAVVLAGIPVQDRPTVIEMLAGLPVGVYFAHEYEHTQAPAPEVIELLPNLLIGSRGLMKRTLDMSVALGALFVLAPLLLLTAMMIKLESKGSVIFQQTRFGLGGQAIKIYKFRTMYTDREDKTGEQRTLACDPRVTPFGRILRRLSIDELPQLVNVLRGDMSIVGPRPHAVRMRIDGEFYEKVVKSYPLRHRVKPGLTGWAQVNGSRGEVDTLAKAERRVDLDLWYIANWSISLDAQIILATALGGFATLRAD